MWYVSLRPDPHRELHHDNSGVIMKEPPHHDKKYSIRIEERDPGHVVLFITGRISLDDLNNFMSDTQGIINNKLPITLDINLGGVTYLDSAGTLALLKLQEEYAARSIPVTISDVTDQIKDIVNLLTQKSHTLPSLVPERKKPTILEQVGEGVFQVRDDFTQIMSFAGELFMALIGSLLHPRSIRWNDVLFYMKRVGLDGLPIVGLISLLMGLIMSFMSSLQLKQFGANIYVASLLAIAMVKELGPIMTAILVAGRSGSAFAAEIGTMIVNDEVNALKIMGFEPTRFLSVPKVLAAVFVVPLLTVYADLFAIIGGLLVGVIGLNLTVYTYLEQTRISIEVFDIVSSFIKSACFAVLIAGIGCLRGFQVTGGAESVGRSTTSAVVSAIFLIIVADSIFAIIINYIGLGR